MGTIRQQVDNSVALEVNEHGAVSVATAEGPVVDAEHAHRRPRRRGRAWAGDDSQVVGRGQDLLNQQPCRDQGQEALGQEP